MIKEFNAEMRTPGVDDGEEDTTKKNVASPSASPFNRNNKSFDHLRKYTRNKHGTEDDTDSKYFSIDIDVLDNIANYEDVIEDLANIEKCKTLRYLTSETSVATIPASYENLDALYPSLTSAGLFPTKKIKSASKKKL